MKSTYMLSCAVAALLYGSTGSAFADTDSVPAGGGTIAASGGIEEVIVTSERRDQSVEKVPMTVQAFTGDQLAELNVLTVDDLLRYTPNVTYGSNGPGQGDIFMRGLSNGFRGDQSTGTVGEFPNVAIYLDEQSMQFPARNVDIYMVDMQRVEVLEGPQGALFGGGAEAGAIRYITNKPDLDEFSASAQGMYGTTAHGDPNSGFDVVANVPLVEGKLAVRLVIYNERQGGYIDNVPATFTRNNDDWGNAAYWDIAPNSSTGLCPNGNPPGVSWGTPGKAGYSPGGYCAPPGVSINNQNLVGKAQNPTTYEGARAEVLYKFNPDWDLLITESLEDLDAEGLSVEYPYSSQINPNGTLQPLAPLEVTAFEPSYDKDSWGNTAWTLNGKIWELKAIYTGGWTERHIDQQMEYTNYSRWQGGEYYECTGGSWPGTPYCYSPAVYWQDRVRNTHMSHEFRLSTPDDWRVRGIVGAYYEQFRIYDDMNFNYKTLPSCDNPQPGEQFCVGNVEPEPGTTANDPSVRSDSTAFGEDTRRGYDQTAFFGNVDFDIIPKTLTATAGTRWYQYNESEVGSEYITNTGCVNVATCSDWVNINAANDHKVYAGFKSRLGLTWNIDDDSMVYYLFSQGFRPGGFNRGANKPVAPEFYSTTLGKYDYQYLQPDSYRPDSLTNNEIGLKKGLFGDNVLVNLSAYYMRWTNEQYILFFPQFTGNTTFSVNGPNFDDKGAELQLVANIFQGLTTQGSLSYNDNTQQNTPCLISNYTGNIPGYPASPTLGQCIQQAVQKGTHTTVPFINPFGVAGSQAPWSPKWQGNWRFRYDWTFGDYLADAMVGLSYMGSTYNQPANYESGVGVLIPPTTYLRYRQPSYTTFDASIGVKKDKWSAELFGENLGDSHASTFTSSAQFIETEVPLRPRVIGIRLGLSY